MVKILSKNSKHIGKIKRSLSACLEKHATKDSSVFNHISDCAIFKYIKNLYCIGNNTLDVQMYDKNSIRELESILVKLNEIYVCN